MVPLEVLVVVQSPSHVQLFATPWTATYQATLSFKLMAIVPEVPEV